MEDEQKRAVGGMLDYIKAHLREKITLLQLAKAAGYSPYHAARMFTAMMGESPFEYTRKQRLAQAAVMLSDGDARIIDVALEFQFDSHEGFTRAFHRQFGMPPTKYRAFMPPKVRYEAYLNAKNAPNNNIKEHHNMAANYFTQVTDFPERKLLLKRGVKATEYFEYCEEVGCEVWDTLCGVKEGLNEPMGLWLPACMRPEGTSEYVQGVEVPMDFHGDIPQGFELAVLPACQMMIFQGEPYDDEKFEQAVGAIWEAIAQYDPTRFGYRWAMDEFPRFQLAPQGYRGYIEGRPVKPL